MAPLYIPNRPVSERPFLLLLANLRDRSILVITPDGPLEKADFEQFARAIVASTGKIAGLMVDAKSFPGWRNFGAFVSHLRFIVDHHRQIERVAVVTKSKFPKVMPRIVGLFIHPKIKHFEIEDKDKALAWLEQVNEQQAFGREPATHHTLNSRFVGVEHHGRRVRLRYSAAVDKLFQTSGAPDCNRESF